VALSCPPFNLVFPLVIERGIESSRSVLLYVRNSSPVRMLVGGGFLTADVKNEFSRSTALEFPEVFKPPLILVRYTCHAGLCCSFSPFSFVPVLSARPYLPLGGVCRFSGAKE